MHLSHNENDTADAYRQLLTAVLLRAWLDSRAKQTAVRVAALAWLHSPGAESLCDWLGLDVGLVRSICGKLSADRMG